jgi:AMMECR1 domain-containing protein
MDSPMDFRPGQDSLLMTVNGSVTFLQSSAAVEHRYDRVGFLRAIAGKAGLTSDGWKDPEINFMRAATIWTVRSLTAIQQSRQQEDTPLRF